MAKGKPGWLIKVEVKRDPEADEPILLYATHPDGRRLDAYEMASTLNNFDLYRTAILVATDLFEQTILAIDHTSDPALLSETVRSLLVRTLTVFDEETGMNVREETGYG